MGLILDRTVTRVGGKRETGPPAPLAAYRKTPAYVLLGDPGAGKTTAFRKEASDSSNGVLFVSARDFLTLDPSSHPEWGEHTLFIDGLDEVRAGQSDARTPFDAMRARLDRLRPPAFRISCRDADWLGKNDATHLESVSPDGAVAVLRLTALSPKEVHEVVSRADGISDPEAFLLGAHDRGLGDLLQNPQTLDLLIKTFGATGQWPATRRETFERGIEQVAREPNPEHRIGRPELPQSAILDAAGWMSAVHLFSGGTRHCLRESDGQPGDVSISVYGEQLHAAADAALRTRLFTDPAPRRFEPAHANFAAFLAARTLVERLANGLPHGRVLALLAGDDGAPPTSLRGLAAWLAVFSPELREPLIKRDPVAVLMYGDVREFTPHEKTLILDQIGHNPDRLYEGWWSASAVAGLATEDMEPSLRTVLDDPDRGASKQKVVEVTVTALRHAEVRANLRDELLGACRDETRFLPVRLAALDAWIESLRHEQDRAHRLRALLDEMLHGNTPDPENELLGTLLGALYPGDLEPSEVWHYLAPQSHLVVNRFHQFWKRLPETCPPAHLASHLDHLTGEIASLRGPLHDLFLDDLPVQFLARGLEVGGAQLDAPRLYRWLQVGLNEWGQAQVRRGDPSGMDRVRQWLEAHPDAQKAVIRVALRTDEFRDRDAVEYHLGELLYHSSLPEDVGQWHLDEASVAENEALAHVHLREFVEALSRRQAGERANWSEALERLGDQPKRRRYLEGLFSSRQSPAPLEKPLDRRRAPKSPADPDGPLLEATQSAEQELLANCASPGLLHSLAQKYYEERMVLGISVGQQHLLDALGGDESLTHAALTAVRHAIEREDLPSAEDLVQLRKRGRMSFFVWPILIGLEDRPLGEIMALGDARLRVALACRLLYLGLAQEAAWHQQCVTERPDLVAEILTLVGRALLAARETSFPDLYQLAHDEQFAPVARRAVLPLLSAFPARAKSAQLPLLDALLRGALHHLRTEPELASLRATIERKAGQPSTTRLVRVRWLAAGLILDPDQFLPRLDRELSGSSLRRRSFGQFFEGFAPSPPQWLTNRLTSASLEFLVRILGEDHNPLGPEPRFGAAIPLLLPGFITQLSGFPDRQASESLDRLVEQERLSQWRPMLDYAREQQRVVRRDSQHKPLSPPAVISTLRDGPPASAADLRELVVDRLLQTAREVRTTNANLWRQFWNEDSGTPKHEDACRDSLVAMLVSRLPPGCDAQPEGQYAANKRSDIRVTAADWNVPVEIKKNSHRDVWSAVRNQLLPRYTNDPATEGLGIYLVLWFGAERTAGVPRAWKPTTPEQMRDQLLAKLTADERHRAVVIVMNVTSP